MKTLPFAFAILTAAALTANAQGNSKIPDRAKLEQMTARFAPTEIEADLSKFSPNDREALAKLVEASRIIDGIYLRQNWPENPSML
ncbi:MAG TPA: hypothetical protein VGF73_04740, partial [Chthoniobacterales bacterium]